MSSDNSSSEKSCTKEYGIKRRMEIYSRVVFELHVAFGLAQKDDRMFSIVAYRTPSACGGQIVPGDFT
jgi:hypothetical protein